MPNKVTGANGSPACPLNVLLRFEHPSHTQPPLPAAVAHLSVRRIRTTHIMIDPQDWIVSKFAVADLHGKTVEYALRGEDGHTYAGEGFLIAVSRGNRMRVRIKYHAGIAPDGSHGFASAFIIPGSDAPKLVRNPSGSKCEFSFKAL